MMNESERNYDWSGKTILVVEDNETSNIYFEAAMRKTGISILWAGNGEDAVKLVRDNPQIDVVLMDINMPKMDGIEATRLIKELRPELPVIVQTAFILSGEEELSFAAGCDEFIAKPVRLYHLLDSIQRFVG